MKHATDRNGKRLKAGDRIRYVNGDNEYAVVTVDEIDSKLAGGIDRKAIACFQEDADKGTPFSTWAYCDQVELQS